MASSLYDDDRFLVSTAAPSYQGADGTFQASGDDHGAGTGVATEFMTADGLPASISLGGVTGGVASGTVYRKSDGSNEIEGPGNGTIG